MKQVGKVLRAPLKAIGLIPKTPRLPAPQRAVTRDDARASASLEEELRRRRGGASDMVTGSGGAEAGSTGRSQLG